MERKKTTKKDSILIHTAGEYEFKLSPGSKTSKPHIYFYFLNPVTNKLERQRKYIGLKPGAPLAELKKEAKKWADDYGNLLVDGWNPITNEYNDQPITPLSTITECMDYWIKQRELQHQNNSLTEKCLKSNRYLMQFFGDWLKKRQYLHRKPSTFNKVDIDNFLQTTALVRKWSKVSYNCYRTDLGTFFNFLVALKITNENPVKLSAKKNTRRDSSRFMIFEEPELRNVVELLAKDDNYKGLYIASKLLFYYNIRPVEITRIQVKNINFEKRTLTLTPDKTKNHNEAIFKLNDELYNLLDDLVLNAPADNYVFGHRCKTSPKQSNMDYFGQKWRAFRTKYNLPNHLKWYALKHSSNYYDLQSGASFEEIRQRNRHSNLQVTTLYIKERLFKNIIKPSESGLF